MLLYTQLSGRRNAWQSDRCRLLSQAAGQLGDLEEGQGGFAVAQGLVGGGWLEP
jgi:hypothetical protein